MAAERKNARQCERGCLTLLFSEKRRRNFAIIEDYQRRKAQQGQNKGKSLNDCLVRLKNQLS